MSETVTLRVRVRAPVERVRHAVTDAAELRTWLAEHAEVELPERYEFWGRHTPEGDAPSQKPVDVTDTSLSFSWELGGEKTTVSISWEPSDEGSVVTLTQSHFPGWADVVAETGVLGWLYTYWALSLANLADHVEGRALTPKADFTTPAQMRGEVLIAAPAAKVFDSMVDAEQFSRWFGAKIDIEPRLGGRVAMGGFDANPDPGHIIDLVENERLGIDWGEGIVQSWELAESDGKTRLTFVQSGFVDGRPAFGAWLGTVSGIAELRRYHELSDWRPIWLEPEVPGMPEGMLTGGTA